MAEFKKLSAVPVREEAADTAKVLVEDGDEIYRVPKTAVGGGGIKTAIIRDSTYRDAIAGASGYAAPSVSYECTNMTFDEAYNTLEAGEPLAVLGMLTGEGGMNVPGFCGFIGTAIGGVKTIVLGFTSGPITMLFWTANGISTTEPPLPK